MIVERGSSSGINSVEFASIKPGRTFFLKSNFVDDGYPANSNLRIKCNGPCNDTSGKGNCVRLIDGAFDYLDLNCMVVEVDATVVWTP